MPALTGYSKRGCQPDSVKITGTEFAVVVRLSNVVSASLVVIFGMLLLASCTSDRGAARKESQEAQGRKEALDSEEALKQELEYGRLLAIKILQKYRLYDDEKVTRYVNMVGKSVALFSGRSDIVYHFGVLDTDAINAFATPGGYIFVTRGVLELAENEAELAGVLGHEIGHVNYKHILRELPPPRSTKSFIDILSAMLLARGAAVSSAFSKVVGQASDLLFEKGYKVNEEYEADRASMLYTSETGYYSGALIDFLARMHAFKEAHGETAVYHTHPPTPKRLEKLREFAEEQKLSMQGPKAVKRFQGIKKYLRERQEAKIREVFREISCGRLVAAAIAKKYPLLWPEPRKLQDSTRTNTGETKDSKDSKDSKGAEEAEEAEEAKDSKSTKEAQETKETQESVSDSFRYLSMVGKAVGMFSSRLDIEYHFAVLKSDKVLAFSAPGGYVLVSRGLLKTLRNEAELAAVLAVQIAHISRADHLKRFPLKAETNAKATALTPALKKTAGQISQFLLNEQYEEDTVIAVDRMAMMILDEIGYYPLALVDVLQRWKKAGITIELEADVDLDERIEKLEEEADTLPEASRKKPRAGERFQRMLKLP